MNRHEVPLEADFLRRRQQLFVSASKTVLAHTLHEMRMLPLGGMNERLNGHSPGSFADKGPVYAAVNPNETEVNTATPKIIRRTKMNPDTQKRNAEAHFDENISRLSEIDAAGGFDNFITERGLDLSEAFIAPTNVAFHCSDERTREIGVRAPGGPLFDWLVLGSDPRVLATKYLRSGVNLLCSHEGCGAAKAAGLATGALKGTPTAEEVDAFAREKTGEFVGIMRQVAAELDLPQPNFEHTVAGEMSSQGGFHPGVAIYVDLVGGFNWRKTPELVQGYTVTDTVSEQPTEAVNALLKLVAFNNGNAGVRLAERGEKFRIVIVCDSDAEYRAQVESIKAKIAGEKYADHIIFDRITKPANVNVW